MKYKMLAIADIHWGVFHPQLQYDRLKFFINLIKEVRPQLVVICGDYFDSKISLNSQVAITAVQWMNDLLEICISISCKLRVIKGTSGHDYDQLEVFNPLENQYPEWFRIFNINTVEETLPELKVMYAGEENINSEDYVSLYKDNIYEYADIGFFHGSFDIILPELVVNNNREKHLPSIIFEYNYWSTFINGPIIAGHWHDRMKHANLQYVGSYDRWKFGEDESKGFLYIEYNTNNHKYCTYHIDNPYSEEYHTYSVNTIAYKANDYLQLMEDIKRNLRDKPNIKIRIIVTIDGTNNTTNDYINLVQSAFMTENRVKIIIKNQIKEEAKTERVRKINEISNDFGFIFDKNKKTAQIIHEFILRTKGQSIPPESVQEILESLGNNIGI